MKYITITVVVATFGLCLDVSYVAAAAYLSVVMSITCIFPLWLYHLQDFKK